MRFWYFNVVLWTICCALPTKKDYDVKPELLPGLSEIEDRSLIPEMYAGHLPLARSNDDEDEIDYFFWRFSRPDKALNTLIIWLNGGPGCSSMDGALVENGPFRVNSDLKLVLNEGSWHAKADMLYVDQPVKSGFSVFSDREKTESKYDTDLTETTQHFMDFLENYFNVFPEDQFKELVIAGESYAGQYVPHLAEAIQKRNSQVQDKIRKYNLGGILIGNGWIDPDAQSLAYLPFAISKGVVDEKSPSFRSLLNEQENCQRAVNSRSGNDHHPFQYEECEKLFHELLTVTQDTSDGTPSNQACVNMYSYNLRDSYPSCGMNWPAEVLSVPGFFDKPGVLEALNLDPSKIPKWKECNVDVGYHLENAEAVPSVHKLPVLLNSGIKVVLYAGEMDLLCNEKGITDMIENLEWGGAKGFSNDSKRYDWKYRDYEVNTDYDAGHVLTARNLSYISVYNASHMVPNDQSLHSRGLVEIYLEDTLLEKPHGNETLVTTSEKNMDDVDDYNNNLGALGLPDESAVEEQELEDEMAYMDELEAEESGLDMFNGEEEEDDSGLDDADGVSYGEFDDGIDDEPQDLDDGMDGDVYDAMDDSDYNGTDDNEKQGDEDISDESDGQGYGSNGNNNGQDEMRGRRQGMLRAFGVLVLAVLSLGSVGFYVYIRKHTHKTRAILVDPNRRQQEPQNKSVSWADLERGYNFEADQSRPGKVKSSHKTKGPYTRVPNTEVDESFELENL